MRRLALLLVPTLVLACDQQPAAPEIADAFSAAVTYNERDVPFTFQFHIPVCGAGLITMEGMDHWVVQYVETSSGRVVDAFRTNYTATAVGEPSGYVYKVNGFWMERAAAHVDGYPYVFIHREPITLVGHGSIPNIRVFVNNKVTINANGDVLVDRQLDWYSCQ